MGPLILILAALLIARCTMPCEPRLKAAMQAMEPFLPMQDEGGEYTVWVNPKYYEPVHEQWRHAMKECGR